MNIRKKLAAFAMAAAAVTTGLGATVMADGASANYYADVTASKHSIVGTDWWSGSEFHMETTSRLPARGYTGSTTISSTTKVWTTSWVGFTGCVSVDYFNYWGSYLGSTPTQHIGTTGIYYSQRSVDWSVQLPTYTADQVSRLQINHFRCPK